MADAPESVSKIDSLREKVEADPKSRHFYPLAEELRKVGQLEEAERVLRAGLTHHANYLSAWISLGRVLKDRGGYAEAVDVLMRGLSLDPENVVAAKLLAHVYLAMGEKVEAIKKFKLVHALMPSDEEAEEQIARLDREINPQNQPEDPPPPPPPVAEAAVEESPHDATEPPFPMDDEPVFESPAEVSDEPVQASEAVRFDLTNPDPFSLGSTKIEQEPQTAEPELADEPAPFSSAELPGPESAEEGSQTAAAATEEDPFGAVPPGEPERDSRRAPSSEDVWAEEEENAGALPESAATVTMAQILAQQGDVQRARDTYERVLEREPENAAARDGLAALDRGDSRRVAATGGRVERLEAWRRKVAGS